MPRHARVPRQYEMMILIAPTVTEEGLPAVVDRIAGHVTEQGGTVARYTYENPWGRRRLAYPIQNFNDAYYVLYFFTAPPAAIEEIERMVRLDDVIIRHLIVKYDPLSERYGYEGSPFDPLPEAPADEPGDADADASADSDAETAAEAAAASADESDDEPADESTDEDDEADEDEPDDDEADEESGDDEADDEDDEKA